MRIYLLAVVFIVFAKMCYGQKTDTLKIFYKPDQHQLSLENRKEIDRFILGGWDKIFITAYTDETDGEEYNLQLSKRRADAVYKILSSDKRVMDVTMQYYGESASLADNTTPEGRSVNRQTRLVGFRFLKAKPRVEVDLMKPSTTTLDNGFIITYLPGGIPEDLRRSLEAGSGMNFQLVTNTAEMRQTGLYTNTTNGEILSSVLVFCGQGLNPCKLDSPIMINVPIPFQMKCPVSRIKFFSAIAENGKNVWQEQTMQVYPEIIDGKQYIRIWMDDLCQCINFDFKIDPECYDTDSARLLLVHAEVKSLTVELSDLNSIYLPRKTTDSTHSLLFLKGKNNQALISFTAYNGKRRLRSFRNKPLTNLPYDNATKTYSVITDSIRFFLPKIKDYDLAIKVNGDRYRTFIEKNGCLFYYVKQQSEKVLVDLWVPGKHERTISYTKQPLSSIPFDSLKGQYVIDKAFLKALALKTAVTRK